MDFDYFRSILRDSGVDVWTVIDTAISVAYLDCRKELKNRRDGIVERLFSPVVPRCLNCDLELPRMNGDGTKKEKHQPPAEAEASIEKESSSHEEKGGSPSTPQSINVDDRDRNFGSSIDDEQMKILAVKEHLEDPNQNEDSLVSLLQNLADMDITFKALKETDIGRHVNVLRKHPSDEVRRLVKHLIRKWKDTVDEWMTSKTSGAPAASALTVAGDSPQQNPKKSTQNVHQEGPYFAYSPNPHNGSSGSDKSNSETEQKVQSIPRRETPAKLIQTAHVASASATPPPSRQKETQIDPEKLASARKRLHDNYQEAQNAKKQRTIQVMDIHDIPKPKSRNSFTKNKGGFQARHW